MSAEDSIDAGLIIAIAAGDQEALISLYRRRRDDMYRYAYAMSRSTALAEDAMHDAFINIMEQAHRFDPARGSVRAWLVGCVRFRVLDRLRESADVVDEVMREVVSEVVSEVIEEVAEQDLAAAIDLRRSTTALHAAISELPLIFREVLVLCELEEMSYADVARLLDCPIGTVRSRLARARQHLVSKLLIPAAAVRCFETPVAPEAAR